MTDEQVEKARREWDFQMRKSHLSLQMWRVLALTLSALTVVLLIYAIGSIHAPRLVPYVVELPRAQGAAKAGVRTAPLAVSDPVVIHGLERFITDLVSVSTDPVVLKNRLRETYTIATPKAQREITRYIAASDPFKAARDGEHVAVSFTEIIPQAVRTWYVEWIETVWALGDRKAERAFAGTFRYVVLPPTGETAAENNPFGLVIEEFSLSSRRTQ